MTWTPRSASGRKNTTTTTTASSIWQVQQYQHHREFLEAETNRVKAGNKEITDNEDNNKEKTGRERRGGGV